MSTWTDLQSDVSDVIAQDGETVIITTDSGQHSVPVFWSSLSLVGGEQEGPSLDAADADLPADLTQGNTVTYSGTTYTIVHRQPDGHGLTTLILHEE